MSKSSCSGQRPPATNHARGRKPLGWPRMRSSDLNLQGVAVRSVTVDGEGALGKPRRTGAGRERGAGAAGTAAPSPSRSPTTVSRRRSTTSSASPNACTPTTAPWPPVSPTALPTASRQRPPARPRCRQRHRNGLPSTAPQRCQDRAAAARHRQAGRWPPATRQDPPPLRTRSSPVQANLARAKLSSCSTPTPHHVRRRRHRPLD
jgi:hypothetical protein